MTKQEARRLAKEINQRQGVCLTGLRRYEGDNYAVDAVDTRTGIPFVVHSSEAWVERVREAKEYHDDKATSQSNEQVATTKEGGVSQ